MYVETGFVFLAFVVTCIKPSMACNGYSLKVNSIKNCVDNSVIKIENGDAILDRDCNLILKGCIDFTKGFKTAKGRYELKKPPMPPMDGDVDFCEIVDNLDEPQLAEIAKLYHMPTKCPIPPGKVCGNSNKKINVSRFKNQLGLALGTVNIKIDATHDTGKSCVDINVTVSRNRARG